MLESTKSSSKAYLHTQRSVTHVYPTRPPHAILGVMYPVVSVDLPVTGGRVLSALALYERVCYIMLRVRKC